VSSRIVEVKRNLDGRVLEFDCKPLLLERTRAVILCELDAPEVVGGGAIVLPAGTRSYGYFWFDRPYIVYHWLVGGATLAYYVNVGRLHSIGEAEVVWDDYAVDVLARPDGSVVVLDEDEVPEETTPALRDAIAAATSRILAELESITEAVERETQSFEAAARTT
jgi:predicted RNA-binding protein associated with RNAse of E/G family